MTNTFEEQCLFEFQVLARRLHRLVRTDDRVDGLASARLSALSTLHEAGSLSLANLARAEGVRPATMSRLADSLACKGWVQRRTVPDDRRSIRLSLTAAGRRALMNAEQKRMRSLALRLNVRRSSDWILLKRGTNSLRRLLELQAQASEPFEDMRSDEPKSSEKSRVPSRAKPFQRVTSKSAADPKRRR